jgi:heme/copper-type cytochrome/quinol oxidase subunit 3
MESYSFLIYSMVVFAEGLATGWIFNGLTGNEMLKLSDNNPVKVDLYSTITFAVSTFTVGIAQLMVGIFLLPSKDGGELLVESAPQ